MNIISEFIDALNIEIDTLKNGKGGNIVSVKNGELIKQTLELNIYKFTLENSLMVPDDTPAKIEVNGVDYDCEIISITGQQVQVSISEKLSNRIPFAKIKTNSWFLLEQLKNKYEENQNAINRFENSEKLFSNKNHLINSENLIPTYSSNAGMELNNYQSEAVRSSINDFITIIWGPPGTGKTQTIAKVIESHLNLGRTVLLLSHSNNAVDQALLKVAEQVRSTYYKDGHLVRLGTPKNEMLEKYVSKNCSLVMVDKIVECKSKELINLKKSLDIKLEEIKLSLKSCEKILSLNQKIENLMMQIEKLDGKIKNIENKKNYTRDQISRKQEKALEIDKKLLKAKNANGLTKFFLGLDPIKIEASLKAVHSSILLDIDQLKNFEKERALINLEKQPIQITKNNVELELNNSLLELGKELSEVQKEASNLKESAKNIQNHLDETNNAIEEIKVSILKNAKLIATTLTKSYLSKDLENMEFDVLLVDEVSMAPMPMLYWAASKAKMGITIVGDFKQLPPICVSKNKLAKKWLGRSIFDNLEIADITSAEKIVKPLYKQYRMNPLISEIVNLHIYDNHLEDDISVKNKTIIDPISNDTALCLIDTSAHNPWCSQFETGGRFNLINALISIEIAKKITQNRKDSEENITIGIITPYRSQAELISKIAKDENISEKVRINTVHSFQGGEETVIIFDSVEGEGSKKWSIINEFDNIENAKLLLNVALTRAEAKLYIVANYNYIQNNFPLGSLFMNILDHINLKGKRISSTQIIGDLHDENFDLWVSKLNSTEERPENIGTNYNDQEFWISFHNDLLRAESELIIFSPYLTTNRLGKLHLYFEQLLSKGIKICVITLSPNDPLQLKNTNEVVNKLKSMNVIVKFREGMHEKIAIIDRKIEWSGSLNILSHNNRKEYMKRVNGENIIKELFQRYALDDLLYGPNLNGEICPECKSNFIRPKNHYGKAFYGCSGYPTCRFTASIQVKNIDQFSKFKQTKSLKNNPKIKIVPNKDLFGDIIPIKQWESKTLYWSSIKLPDYKYSTKKNAWWKKKEI